MKLVLHQCKGERALNDSAKTPCRAHIVDKARQVFLRSARQANFFELGEDRLVRPAAPTGPGTPPTDEKREEAPEIKHRNGSGDSTDGLDLDPLLIALLKKIPSTEKGMGTTKGALVPNVRNERVANL